MMDNEPAFAAEAEVEAYRAHVQRSSHQGHDMLQIVSGGFEAQSGSASEHTPLLAPPRRGLHSSAGSTEDAPPSPTDQSTWDGEHDFDGLPWYRTPSVYWLLPAFLLYTTAFGGTMVPRINLVLSLICKRFCAEQSMKDPTLHVFPIMEGAENPQCQIPEVQALVSKFSLYSSLIAGILSAITSPPLGALSDRYGRVRMQCAITLGAFSSEIITILVATYPDTFSVNWMLLGSFLDGLGGSFTAAMAIVYAYTSDCTAPEDRNVAFGYIHGCLFFGIALGPLFAGYIIKATGSILSIFYIATSAHAVFTLWLLLVVPESLTKERQLNARKKAAHAKELHVSNIAASKPQGFGSTLSRLALMPFIQLSKLFAPLSILWPTEPGTNPALRRNLLCLAAVDTTLFGVAMGSITIVLIYAEYAFGWGNFETSIYVSITNTSRVAVLVILLPLVTRLLRGPAAKRTQQASGCDNIDLGIIRLSIVFDLLGYIGFATLRTGTLFTLSGVIASIGGMGSPTLGAAITKHVPPDRTGKVLGAMGFLHAAARVVAPTIFNLIYARTVGKFTPTVFICLAATFFIAFAFSLFLRPNVRWDVPYIEPGLHGEANNDQRDSDDSGEGPSTIR